MRSPWRQKVLDTLLGAHTDGKQIGYSISFERRSWLIGMSMMTTMKQPNVNTMSGRIGTTAVTEETQRAAAEK